MRVRWLLLTVFSCAAIYSSNYTFTQISWIPRFFKVRRSLRDVEYLRSTTLCYNYHVHQNYLYFLRTGKRLHLRRVLKVHFVCLEGYGSLLQISPNKIVKYTWVPSSMKQKQTPATVARTPRHHYTNYATFMVLRQDSTVILDYPKLHIHSTY